MSNFSFNNVPVIRHSRSQQDLSHGVKTSGNVGTLYPFECQEVYPGDTFKVQTAVVSRLSSQFIKPVMDNLFLDVYFFYVPSRILYAQFPNVFGENTESAWANTQEYSVPTFAGTVPSKSVGDYLGLPVGMSLQNISVLPFRAFGKVYDDWFRDQNNVSPMHIQNGARTSSETPNSNAWSPNNYFGLPPKVAKFHDLFTSALPAPQKGEATSIPIAGETAPVTGYTPVYGLPYGSWNEGTYTANPVRLTLSNGSSLPTGGLGVNSNGMLSYSSSVTGGPFSANNFFANLGADFDSSQSTAVVDLSSASGVTVNDLRFAFQYQKMLERDSRSGSRFIEMIASHFGVQAGDYRLQRSEFLGGRRTPLSIHQVVQSTGSDSDSAPLGQVGAYSLSNGRSRFTKSFVEHGYVIGVYCIRQHHSYQQGVERFWNRSQRTDFYDPVFSHIGEQPIYATQLYGSAPSDQVFGYGEAWYDLRFRPNRISGQMRSGVTDSLDVWHLADYYQNAPTLNSQFIEETPTYVDRVITVESSQMDQFILDFYIQNRAYRVIPTYSVPSLIDHD